MVLCGDVYVMVCVCDGVTCAGSCPLHEALRFYRCVLCSSPTCAHVLCLQEGGGHCTAGVWGPARPDEPQ